jgi:hypothetical protein
MEELHLNKTMKTAINSSFIINKHGIHSYSLLKKVNP